MRKTTALAVLALIPFPACFFAKYDSGPQPNQAPAYSAAAAPAPVYNDPPPGITYPDAPPPEYLSQAELEDLVSPIALYPDPLLAQVLAASIYPEEVSEVARLVFSGTPASVIAAQDFEPAVKAIAELPDVLRVMTEYPDWTDRLGEAYVWQAQDLMAAVQALRRRSYDYGYLRTSPEIVVDYTPDLIIIVPARPSMVFVPVYDPDVFFFPRPPGAVAAGMMMSFGMGFMMGSMWDLDCDWHGGFLSSGHGHHHHGHGGGKNKNDVDVDVDVNVNNKIVINKGGKKGPAFKPNNKKVENWQKKKVAQGRGGPGRDGAGGPGGPGDKGTKSGDALPAKIPGREKRNPVSDKDKQGGRKPAGARPGGRDDRDNRADDDNKPKKAAGDAPDKPGGVPAKPGGVPAKPGGGGGRDDSQGGKRDDGQGKRDDGPGGKRQEPPPKKKDDGPGRLGPPKPDDPRHPGGLGPPKNPPAKPGKPNDPGRNDGGRGDDPNKKKNDPSGRKDEPGKKKSDPNPNKKKDDEPGKKKNDPNKKKDDEPNKKKDDPGR